jgi:hypothetical protein
VRLALSGNAPQEPRHEHIDEMIDELGACVAEQRLSFCIDERNPSATINANDCAV